MEDLEETILGDHPTAGLVHIFVKDVVAYGIATMDDTNMVLSSGCVVKASVDDLQPELLLRQDDERASEPEEQRAQGAENGD